LDEREVVAEEAPEEIAGDPKLPAARDYLMATYFASGSRTVYYQRQLQVLAEGQFFHWITAYALGQLVAAGRIGSETQPFGAGAIRYYWPRGHRDRKTQVKAIRKLIDRMAEPGFARGVGRHGETMIDAALPRIKMVPVASEAREFNGEAWTSTQHDLDRIFELDGVAYGIEIKNQLQYIDFGEFDTKLAMCRKLKIKPLFVMRMLPKSYTWEVYRQGGYALIMKYQLYPHGAEDFAKEVRDTLALPVDAPPSIHQPTLNRLLAWHHGTRDVPANSVRIHGQVVEWEPNH